ncbi:GNAT family N-acetyltransferase [Cupriavidus sp. TMH.W2]|uniref:GNAT family N-acetyltransferase n=1 Tax=Cupriavidus sp. TMH.W2 TaxID=3434465 RepID=UPI003D774380
MSVVKQLLRWRWRPPVPAAAPSIDPAPVVYTYQTPSPSPDTPGVRKAADPGGPSAQSRALDRLPPLVVKAAADHFRVVTAPSPEFRATLHNGASEEVGTAKYGLSPLGDRVYVYDIRVPPAHQRCGYATALLWYLAREYGRPITPVQELHAASGFWNAARALAGAGVVVTEPVWDLEAEAARWAHLRPDAERLAEQILERLHVRREPWQVAVGRGLDAEAPAARRVGAPCAADRDGPSPG